MDLSNREIVSIVTEGERKYRGSEDDERYSSSVFMHIERIEKPGEMAMVGWYQCIRSNGAVVEVNEKFVVEVEYAPEAD